MCSDVSNYICSKVKHFLKIEYLTLIGRIGADRAAYGPLVVPVIALTLSQCFEGYAWSTFSIVGIALIIAGNFLVLRFKKKLEAPVKA